MTIRAKVITLIAFLSVGLVVAEYIVEQGILMPSFAQLERADAAVAMRRIGYALDQASNRLAASATDWGNWSQTWRFAQDRNAAYVTENMTPVALKDIDVNMMLIVRLDGEVILASDSDPDAVRPLHLVLMEGAGLTPGFPWRRALQEGRPMRGYLQTDRGIMMLAAAPVLDGNAQGPSRGMVIMGRLMTLQEISQAGQQAQVGVALLAPPVVATAQEWIKADTVTHVFRTVRDIYDKPITTLRVDVPRTITQHGRSAVRYASAWLMGAAVLVLILFVVLLDRVILGPLGQVTRHAVAIGRGADLTMRLDLKREDEIGVLAHEFDRMVERLADSRRQLVDQSFAAGFAEMARGVLHNLGNAMTPIGVRLAGLQSRLREAPVEDAGRAVVELENGTADPQRRAALQDFVRMACKELALTVNAAEADVAIMMRQAAVVQSTLTEQLRSGRNEHVVEAVQLPELLAHTLEIVPEICRQRLIVHADDSLRKVGTLEVQRTVVRLVLQNLIINAADAVRDAGKERGILRVAAEVQSAGGFEQLHMFCTDEGNGIAEENLERIFEKGFSTKSRETNCGIGLHWCANAINALGGTIWAVSEGPGRGASIHFIVPLAVRDALAGAA